jgi:hypothetical protein
MINYPHVPFPLWDLNENRGSAHALCGVSFGAEIFYMARLGVYTETTWEYVMHYYSLDHRRNCGI